MSDEKTPLFRAKKYIGNSATTSELTLYDNKTLKKQLAMFMKKFVPFAMEKHKIVEIDGENVSVVLISDIIEFIEGVEKCK